jgi:hypothetical protein
LGESICSAAAIANLGKVAGTSGPGRLHHYQLSSMPSAGSYSSNVNLAVENSSWSDESQLQEMYLKRKSYAFNSDRPGAGK